MLSCVKVNVNQLIFVISFQRCVSVSEKSSLIFCFAIIVLIFLETIKQLAYPQKGYAKMPLCHDIYIYLHDVIDVHDVEKT